MDLGFGLLLIVWHTIGLGIIVNSLPILKVAFKKKDFVQLFNGTVYFGCGLVSFLYSSIVTLLGAFDTLRLTYVWTFIATLLISYFLFPYIAKTKKFKSVMKKFLYEEEDTGSLSHSSRKSPFIEKSENIFILIFYLAIFLGIIFLLVKLVKYFWYL